LKPSKTSLEKARFAVWNRLSSQQDLQLLQAVPHPVHLLAKSGIYIHCDLLKYFIKCITVIKHKHFLVALGTLAGEPGLAWFKTNLLLRNEGLGRKVVDKNIEVG
jgi:hypothetical protein